MNKKLVSLVLSGLIILTNVHCMENVYANEKNTNNEISSKNIDNNSIVQIPDVDLKNAICKKLNVSNTTNITVAQLQTITELTLNTVDTSNLQGIQYCKNLKELSIINGDVSDISLLSGLTNLETLNLEGNDIKNLSPLSSLTNLKTLNLESNLISDVSALSKLTNLKTLNLFDNCISDLRPLSSIKNNLDKDTKFNYQTIFLNPVEIKGTQVIMEIPEVYDINGKLLEKTSMSFELLGSDNHEIVDNTVTHKIVGNTVVWNNVKEGHSLRIICQNDDKTFDVSFIQKVIKPQTNISLTDIKSHWAEENINNFINKGYINGYEDSTFKPDNSITRAEFIKIFNKYFGLTNTSGQSFSDTANHWAKDEIDIAITNKIVSGFEDKTFRPDEPITREQAALIISNYKKLPNNNLNSINKYSDSNSISNWAKNAVEAMLEKGYMSGYFDNTLKPKNNLTRAEAVTLLSRIK